MALEGLAINLRNPFQLPFHFIYGGKSSDALLPTWESDFMEAHIAHKREQRILWQHPEDGLLVTWQITSTEGLRAVEWTLTFENRGEVSSKILTEVRILRQSHPSIPIEVIYATGGLGNWWLGVPRDEVPANFDPLSHRLDQQSDPFTIAAYQGWSSNHYLPFWLVIHPEGTGSYYGLGWTGQWVAEFTPQADGVVVTAGMQHLNLRLEPGERIRQPSVLMGSFEGGRWSGHNALRSTLYEHYAPTLNGEKPLAPVSWNHWFTFGNAIDDQSILEQLEALAPLGIEYFCVDAGWYNVDFWECGDWRPNSQKFPHGLKPIATAIADRGMKMGLWFDPERVTGAAYPDFEHKAWLVPAGKKPALEGGRSIDVWLLNLGLPEARQWIVDLIGDYVKRLNLKWIRWDMNYPPLEMWLDAHEGEPNRLGMQEIRYIEGLYAVLDTLRKNHPDLLIEWCAGGGRRIDLETIQRSHTFWKSDLTGDGDVTRPHLTGGNLFLPGTYLNSNLIHLAEDYDFYSQFAGPLGFGHDFRQADAALLSLTEDMITRYKTLRGYLSQDYYPLFADYERDPAQLTGWQFHDPEAGSGFFLVFRPSSSPTESETIRLFGLDPAREYVLQADKPPGLPKTLNGRALTKGFPVTLASERSALLVTYEAK
jgi:alpha-galactosidase